jgi:uncharacterized protein (UPF0332 family)
MTADFISLAGKLVVHPSLGDDEARFRTAVSRAYYGAFHLAASLLAEWGIRVRRNAYGHQDVYSCFCDADHPEARNIASLLDDLRTERIKADYRMDDHRFETPANAMLCVEMAESVKNTLKRCRETDHAIRDEVLRRRSP